MLAWWRVGRNYTQTWGQLRLYLRYYFAFMMFNGGVVFTSGWVRIYGGLLFAILAAKLIYVRWSAADATSEHDRDWG